MNIYYSVRIVVVCIVCVELVYVNTGCVVLSDYTIIILFTSYVQV